MGYAVLINEHHLTLFKKHNATVGVSLDGPGPLKDVRWAGSLERTRASTARAKSAMYSLCDNGIDTHLVINSSKGRCSTHGNVSRIQIFINC
jgi:uncharacterized protein